MTLPFDSWELWVNHTSTEEAIAKVIARRHREQYQYTRCPYPSCTDHPETITSDNPRWR